MGKANEKLPFMSRPDATHLSENVPINVRAYKQAHKRFQEHIDRAVNALVAIVDDPDADHGHRIQAAKEILNRAYGQAPSHAVIESFHAHEHRHVINEDALKSMSSEQLEHLESTLATLMPKAIEHDDSESENES